MVVSRVEAVLSREMQQSLAQADALWQRVRGAIQPPVVSVVGVRSEALGALDWDLVICGGTLGILLGAALTARGWRVALIERGQLQGRAQEWNISQHEMAAFLELGLLSAPELERAVVTEISRARIAFQGGPDLWVSGVLDRGVDPVYLLAVLKAKFLAQGGHLFEQTAFERVTVHPDGVAVQAGSLFKTRLLIDAMGYFSPIARAARRGEKPDGVCLVVGSCATGFPKSDQADLIATFTPIERQCQYFWEAFPARDGRTTYLFTYLDAHPERFSLQSLMEDYLRLLPTYQDTALEDLQLKRALFGLFPSYRTRCSGGWDRVIAVGDSAQNQSPLSFGGFGAMVRHLGRLSGGIDAALKADCLGADALGWLQPYQPNLAVTWLFQKAMSVELHEQADPDRINRLLGTVFGCMDRLGDRVLKPFLQDVVQFEALTRTLLSVAAADPRLVAGLVTQVGPQALWEWTGHYLNLGSYALFDKLAPVLRPLVARAGAARYRGERRLESWQYGSGGDYWRAARQEKLEC